MSLKFSTDHLWGAALALMLMLILSLLGACSPETARLNETATSLPTVTSVETPQTVESSETATLVPTATSVPTVEATESSQTATLVSTATSIPTLETVESSQTATPMPTVTPIPTPQTGESTPTNSWPVVSWYGYVLSAPADSQFDDYIVLLLFGEQAEVGSRPYSSGPDDYFAFMVGPFNPLI